MSGANRNIQADLQNEKPATMEEYKKAFTPENIRTEDGVASEDKKS